MPWLELSQKIYSVLSREISLLENSLREEITTTNIPTQKLNDYILSSHGKYLRPIMLFLSYYIARGVNEMISKNSNLIKIATAIELIHMATLIHDDVIDEGKIRRNKATINVLYGNDVAVLLGDKLFAKAFFILSHIGNTEIIRLLAKTVHQICLAEINHALISQYPKNYTLTENEYLEMIKAKTANFFAACCQCGVMIGNNTNNKILNLLSNYGEYFGMAFQIMDDIIDLIGDEKKEGKTLRTDLMKGKITLPIINLIKIIHNKKYPTLLDMWEKNENLWNPSLKKAFNKVDVYIKRAKRQLDYVPDSTYKKGLLTLCEYLDSRRKEFIQGYNKK